MTRSSRTDEGVDIARIIPRSASVSKEQSHQERYSTELQHRLLGQKVVDIDTLGHKFIHIAAEGQQLAHHA